MEDPPHSSSDVSQYPANPGTTARALLDAYYFQDQRESAIVQNEPDAAAEAGAAALRRMADSFESEFPDRGLEQARTAGREFMRGLFVQDEIENHHLIANLPLSDFDAVLLTDPTTDQTDPATDERWDLVRQHLADTCSAVGIDDEYSDLQTHFWLLHGQLNEYWEEVAKRAHRHKLEAMIGPVPTEIHRKLGSYFVEGVKLHDDWSHCNKGADFEEVEDIVTRYYRRVFELRAER